MPPCPLLAAASSRCSLAAAVLLIPNRSDSFRWLTGFPALMLASSATLAAETRWVPETGGVSWARLASSPYTLKRNSTTSPSRMM